MEYEVCRFFLICNSRYFLEMFTLQIGTEIKDCIFILSIWKMCRNNSDCFGFLKSLGFVNTGYLFQIYIACLVQAYLPRCSCQVWRNPKVQAPPCIWRKGWLTCSCPTFLAVHTNKSLIELLTCSGVQAVFNQKKGLSFIVNRLMTVGEKFSSY